MADKERGETQHAITVDDGMGADAAVEDSPSKTEARVSTPLKRKKAADGINVRITSCWNWQIVVCMRKCESWYRAFCHEMALANPGARCEDTRQSRYCIPYKFHKLACH